MRQAVLISIHPRWCKLIASGKKPIEVRKTKPKILPPFRCYIYCTKGGGDFATHFYEDADGNFIADEKTYSAFLSGHVIGEFVCDWCDPIHIGKSSGGWLFCFQTQNDKWNDPPVVWNSYPQVYDWLKKNVVETEKYVIMNEYDEIVPFDEFIDMVQWKQNDEVCRSNPDNFSYSRNVDGYRFADEDFC